MKLNKFKTGSRKVLQCNLQEYLENNQLNLYKANHSGRDVCMFSLVDTFTNK